MFNLNMEMLRPGLVLGKHTPGIKSYRLNRNSRSCHQYAARIQGGTFLLAITVRHFRFGPIPIGILLSYIGIVTRAGDREDILTIVPLCYYPPRNTWKGCFCLSVAYTTFRSGANTRPSTSRTQCASTQCLLM